MSRNSNEIIRDLQCRRGCRNLTSEGTCWCGRCFARTKPTILAEVEKIKSRLEVINGVVNVCVSSGYDEIDFFVRGIDNRDHLAKIAIIDGQVVLRSDIN